MLPGHHLPFCKNQGNYSRLGLPDLEVPGAAHAQDCHPGPLCCGIVRDQCRLLNPAAPPVDHHPTAVPQPPHVPLSYTVPWTTDYNENDLPSANCPAEVL